MKSSARWTTAIAAAACLALPTAGWAQTPPTSQSPTTQQPSTQKQPSTSADQQSGDAQEHLRQAQAALKDVPATIPAPAKAKVAELRRHLNALEKSSESSTAAKPTASSKNTWSKDVAAIDKILTELLGPASGSSASEPTGTTGATGEKSSQSRSTTAMTLDETTKSKLMEVRTHVTAYAAAKSGTSGPAASAASPEPSAADPAAAAAAQPPTSSQPSPSQPSEPTPQSSQPASPSSPSSASPSPSEPSAQQPTQSPTGAEQAQQPAASAGQQADPEASKRHLTAARESLSQLTQLPAAAQLSGEPRTQVSQLISNFNELITTKENWRESYDKVEANVTALIGPESAGETAPAPAAQPGAAVGTTGTTASSLDPAIRAKLVEFRTHLKQFEQAAGVSNQASTAEASTPASTPSEPTASTPTGTTGQSTPSQSTPSQSTPSQSPATTSASSAGQDDALRHIDAIEAILNGRSAASSSTPAASANAPTGTTGTTTGAITLNQSQVEEIRMHLAELRKAAEKK